MAFAGARDINASHSVFQDINANQVVIINPPETSKATQIYRWLLAPDPSSNQEDAYRKREANTGTWLVEGEQFYEWKNDPKSFLVIYGKRTSIILLNCFSPMADVRL
jgi:hypothetical protein